MKWVVLTSQMVVRKLRKQSCEPQSSIHLEVSAAGGARLLSPASRRRGRFVSLQHLPSNLRQHCRHKWSETSERNKRRAKVVSDRVLTIALLAAYLVCGIAFYSVEEVQPCGPGSGPAVATDAGSGASAADAASGDDGATRQCHWSKLDAVYFAVVTMSTVG